MNEASCPSSPLAIRRRDLLKGAAGVAAATILPRHVLGGSGQTAPSQKVNLAAVGVGGVGFGQAQACEKGEWPSRSHRLRGTTRRGPHAHLPG